VIALLVMGTLQETISTPQEAIAIDVNFENFVKANGKTYASAD